MKVITIKQPWATLIAEGYKEYEFRTWKTKYRGDILIHAGKSIDKKAMDRFKSLNLEYPVGQIIAKATITDCIYVDDKLRNELSQKDSLVYKNIIDNTNNWEGYGFKIENITKINPIKINGKLSLWDYDYKNSNEQTETFISILERNKELIDILDFTSKLNMPNFYIASGAIFQTIWNYFDNKDLNNGIKDIDVIYYDNTNLSVEKDLEYYEIINKYVRKKGYSYEIDVSNEARMHIWKIEHNQAVNLEPYKNSEDAMKSWIATVQAVGITKENNKIKVYAPFSLNDIFNKTIRPIKNECNSKELYTKKVASWQKRFNDLNIIEW